MCAVFFFLWPFFFGGGGGFCWHLCFQGDGLPKILFSSTAKLPVILCTKLLAPGSPEAMHSAHAFLNKLELTPSEWCLQLREKSLDPQGFQLLIFPRLKPSTVLFPLFY